MTPWPQPGQSRPRLFRLAEDRALINRMGFPSRGMETVARRVVQMRRGPMIVGVNVGANATSVQQGTALDDYVAVLRRLAPLADYVTLPISAALETFDGLELSEREALIASRVLREIRDRLRFLHDVGVGYLTLNRSAATLSGGEGQRIRLATQIGANLAGVLYVLDEPSIGLHQRDNRKLLATLSRLRDLGNTVVVVEHDEETIRTADYVVDLGPGAG